MNFMRLKFILLLPSIVLFISAAIMSFCPNSIWSKIITGLFLGLLTYILTLCC